MANPMCAEVALWLAACIWPKPNRGFATSAQSFRAKGLKTSISAIAQNTE